MKFKKIISLFLVLTLISSLLTSVSLLSPTAEDGAASEQIKDTYVLYGKGKYNESPYGITVYFEVPAENVEADKEYTVSLVEYGFATDSYSNFAVRQGWSGDVLAQSGYDEWTTGTLESTYTGATKWTAKFTTTAKDSLFIGFHIQADQLQNAEFYLGNIEVLDENGNNIAPELEKTTTIHNSINHQQPISSPYDLADFFETIKITNINDIGTNPVKGTFVESGDSGAKYVLHGKGKNPPAGDIAVYVRIPAENVEANKKYTISLLEYGFATDTYNNFAVRQGAGWTSAEDPTDGIILAQSGYAEWTTGTLETTDTGATKWTAEFTTTAKHDLFVGLRIQPELMATAEFYLGNIEVLDENGNNIAPELEPTTDIHRGANHYNWVTDYAVLSDFFETIEIVNVNDIGTNPVKESFVESGDSTANYVLHAKGKSDASGALAVYVCIPSANVEANKKYTVSVVQYGFGMDSYNNLAVKQGWDSTAPLVQSGEFGTGTLETLDTGATKWTAEFTTTAQDDLFVGLALQSEPIKTAEFYLGNIEIVDEEGNNIAPELQPGMFINSGSNHYNQTHSSFTLTNYFETIEVVNVNDGINALKQTLFNDFYTGDSALQLEMGSANDPHAIYKRIPATKLKEDTKYNLTIKFSGFTLNSDSFVVMRDTAAASENVLTSIESGKVTEFDGYSVYTAEYTTPATLSEDGLFIGFYVHGDIWRTCKIEIAEMSFVEDGKTENLFTPLSDMTDLCAGYYGTIITQFTCANIVVSAKKVVLDESKYTEPADKDAAKYILHAKSKAVEGSYGIAIYFEVPAEKIEANKTYTVSIVQQGFGLDSYNNFAVRQGQEPIGSGYGGVRLAQSGEFGTGTPPTTYSGASKWTTKVTTTQKASLYIGLRIQPSRLATSDFYLGDLKVIDENGNNIAPELLPTTTIHNSINHEQPIYSPYALSDFFETIEFVRMDKIADEEFKQTIFNNFYSGDSMYNLSVGSANEQHTIYKAIPASKLTANTRYKLSFKYSGATVSGDNYIVLRDSVEDYAPAVFSSSSSGEFINHGTYMEYVNYYTTPEIPVTLYFGIFLKASTWANSQLYIGDIQMIDANGENIMTPLSDMSDLCNGYGGRTINKYTSANTVIKAKKLALDTEKFSDPVSTDRKMVNIEGLSGTDGARLYVRIPGALPGTYQVSYKTKDFDYNGDDSCFAVKTKSSGTSDNVVTAAGTNLPETLVSQTSLDEATYQFTATDFTDIYVGFDVAKSLVPDMDFIIENLELVRIADGENLIDGNLNLTNWISFNGDYTTETKVSIGENGIYQGSVYKISLVDYDETALYSDQIVNIKGGKEPKYVLHAKAKSTPLDGIAVYVKIPADNVEANKTYTVKVVQLGFNMDDYNNLGIRQSAAKVGEGGVILARTGNLGTGVLGKSESGAYEWSIQVTTTEKTDLFVGLRLQKEHLKNSEFYLGNIEVIDENGNNIAPELEPTTYIHRSAHHENPIHNYAVLSQYFETIEFVDINTIKDSNVVNVFAENKPENDDAGSEEQMNRNYQLGKRAYGLEPGTYKITMVQQGLNVKDFANPNFRVVLNGNVEYQTYDEATRQAYVTKVGVNSYKFEATVTVEEDNSYIQCEYIVGPYVMSNLNSYIKELSVVKVDGEDESENLLSALNVRDWRAANGDFLTADKYNSLLQSINNIDLGVADVNGNGKVDVADMRILRKMQDAGVEVTDDTNLATLRNNLLGIAS